MGCGGSSQSSGGGGGSGGGGRGGGVIASEPNYPGPSRDYKFVNLDISKVQLEAPQYCQGQQFHTLSEGLYFPALADLYNLGYKMATFTVTPGSIKASGFTSVNFDTKSTYQGVFYETPPEEKGKWSLVLKKSVLPQQVFGYSSFNVDSASQPDHIFQTIDASSKAGCRLVSVEVTGGSMVKANAPSINKSSTPSIMLFGKDPNSILGVDLFFEEPKESTEKYLYSITPQRMMCIYSPLSGAIGGSWQLQFDWMTTVNNHLSQGWRLVEVFLDQNNKQMADRTFMASKITIDLGAMFIFEKPSSKMNDNTPVYEVKMVEYQAPGQMKMTGLGETTLTIKGMWENTIQMEGRNGWELVRILQTPALKFQQGLSMSPKFGSVHYMFYQRKIITAPPPVQQETQDKPPEPVTV